MCALRAATFSLDSGRVVSLMGRSGSGKSTLLRILCGIEAADAGSLTVDGDVIRTPRQRLQLRRGRVALVFQDLNLVPELTLGENITLACHLAGKRGVDAREALDRVSVADLANRLPGAVSGGEQQRAAIARALALGVPYILADEPTGALDEENANLMCDAFSSAAQSGAAVLVATHDPVVDARADVHWRISHGELETAA